MLYKKLLVCWKLVEKMLIEYCLLSGGGLSSEKLSTQYAAPSAAFNRIEFNTKSRPVPAVALSPLQAAAAHRVRRVVYKR